MVIYHMYRRNLGNFFFFIQEMESQFAEEWGEVSTESGTEDDEDDEGSDPNTEFTPENLYCVACEKFFKSIKA